MAYLNPQPTTAALAWSWRDRKTGYVWMWLNVLALLLGLVALVADNEVMVTAFFVGGYAILLAIMLRTVIRWRDLINPLTFLLAIPLVRFTIPGILLAAGVQPPDDVDQLFQVMALTDADWLQGHILALLGMLALSMGWLLVQQNASGDNFSQVRFVATPGVRSAAVFGMAVGFGALLMFVLSNASLSVITSGEFRSTTIQEGTGKYFGLAYALIAGSVLLCSYLLARGYGWRSLGAVIPATLSFWTLGGRSRALFPLAGGLLLLWYFSREGKSRSKHFSPGTFVMVPVIVTAVIWLSYFGALYRGGFGAEAFAESFRWEGLVEYFQSSVFTDFGQLHSLAGAIAVGPGVLKGGTFMGPMLWPFAKMLKLPGRSGGVYLAETLVGFREGDSWAFNTSLIGDGYLNFGLVGVVVCMVIFGAVTKLTYLRFRQGAMHAATYALMLIAGFQVLWGSIDTLPNGALAVGFVMLFLWLGKTVLRTKSRTESVDVS